MLVPLRKDERSEFRKKIAEKCDKSDWVLLANPPLQHHMFYQVEKDESEIKSTAVTTDDDYNLDDL